MLNLRTFDLNLLRVFEALHHDRNVSRAADKLGMSQPAVSNALNRLREQLDDSLFVRTAGGMEPTPKAELLASFIHDGLATIRAGLASDLSFDPATSRRRFRLLLTGSGAITFLPKVMSTLSRAAPHIDLAVSEFGVTNYAELLENGVADLAVGRFKLNSALRSQLIHTSTFVVLLSRDHPLLETGENGEPTISYDSYLAAPHVVFTPPGSTGDPIGEALGLEGARLRVALTIPHVGVLPAIMRGTHLVASIPDALATYFARELDLRICALPFKTRTNYIFQWWHKRNDRDPGHRWLRQLFADAGGHKVADVVESAFIS